MASIIPLFGNISKMVGKYGWSYLGSAKLVFGIERFVKEAAPEVYFGCRMPNEYPV